MRLVSPYLCATLAVGLALLAVSARLPAQQPASALPSATEQFPESPPFPESPQPQFTVAAAEPPSQPPSADSKPAQNPAAQGSSSSQAASAQPPAAAKSPHDLAEEQIKEQEKQRVVGILPAFNVSYRSDAASLTAGQKMRLAFRSSIDPVSFATAFLVAGYHEGMHDDIGFPWGVKGYGERSGAAYLDSFDGTMIGNGILPSILHQDPRYFRLGHGTTTHRLLYALATIVVCKHDNTGKWEPNYSNVLGNLAAGGISNLYYPPSDSGIGQTFSNGLIVTAEGGFGSIFQEFWPDISRKYFHRDPTHGLDAQLRADSQAEQAKKQAQKSESQKSESQETK
jgi:hypothetical protein